MQGGDGWEKGIPGTVRNREPKEEDAHLGARRKITLKLILSFEIVFCRRKVIKNTTCECHG